MKFKVGDMVKVVRGVRSYARDGMGAGKQWVTDRLEEMDETIGGVFEIKDTDDSCGYRLDLNSGRWYCFPESALELVEETQDKQKSNDPVYIPFGKMTKEQKMVLLEAFADGKELEHADPRYTELNWKSPACSFYDDRCYRVVEKKYKEPIIPWKSLSKDVKWYARDEDGRCFFFNEKPDLLCFTWGVCSDSPLACADYIAGHVPGDCPWEESLVERPEGE